MHHLPGFHRHSSKAAEPVPEDTSYNALFHKALKAAKDKLKLLKPHQRKIAIGAAAVVGLVVVYKTAAHAHTLLQRRRRRQLLRCCEQDGELHVFILPRSPWSPSLSPACTRVEAYLRANGIPYKAFETIDPTGSPSGELPFLVYKRSRVDSLPRIFDFLTAEFSVTMDDGLTREERAVGAALRRTLEYSMERFLYRTVFIDHPTLAIAQIARALHISHLRARVAVRRYGARLHERFAITAYGALVSEQYENEFLLDCEALETQIGDKRFLFSDTDITSYDCAVYALLVPFAYMGKYTALSTAYMAVADSTVLMAYITRLSKRLFADVASRFDAADMSFETSCASSSIVEEEEEKEKEGGSHHTNIETEKGGADGQEAAAAVGVTPTSTAMRRDVEVSDEELSTTQKPSEVSAARVEKSNGDADAAAAAAAASTKEAITASATASEEKRKKAEKAAPRVSKGKKALSSSSTKKGKTTDGTADKL